MNSGLRQLVSFRNPDGETRLGALVDGDVCDLAACYEWYLETVHPTSGLNAMPADMISFITLGDYGLEMAARAVDRVKSSTAGAKPPLTYPADQVRLLPPIPNPSKIVCLGLVFFSHCQVTNREAWEYPEILVKPPTSLIGPGDNILLPKAWPEKITYGTELTLVIGRKARNVEEKDAMDYVYGYTILNDVTTRSRQGIRIKLLDTAAPVGPCVVPKAFIPDPSNLRLLARVNGAPRQAGNTKDMMFTFANMVRDVSQTMTLYPGDIIATGDIGIADWLRPGDVVETEVEGIGVLRNPVAMEM